MEERRTAAIVLSILALIAIIIFVIVPYINLKSTHMLSYKNCIFHFKYEYDVDTTDVGYVSAQNELALCLCDAYKEKRDVNIGKQILELYKKYGTSVSPDTLLYATYNNIDSILKYKNKAFNRLILLD